MPQTRTLNRARLVEFLVTQLGLAADELQDDTPLFTGGLLDSFSMVDLIQFLEQESGLQMSETEVNLENLDSVRRILGHAASRS
jgi:acyl carrier protein